MGKGPRLRFSGFGLRGFVKPDAGEGGKRGEECRDAWRRATEARGAANTGNGVEG